MIQFQRVSKEGIAGLRNIVETLAEAEGLQAHARSVSIPALTLNHDYS